jgi:polysaccharide pyruvyl transferase WcaK-like protein
MEKTDVQHSHGVVAHMQHAERAEILRRRYSLRRILDVMGHFESAVGIRLHILIFATLRGVPFATAIHFQSLWTAGGPRTGCPTRIRRNAPVWDPILVAARQAASAVRDTR